MIIIEIPKQSKLKIERDEATGSFLVDRHLPIPCPTNYGFIEGTLCPDGDALDVFVLGDRLPTGTVVDSYEVLGVFSCLDGGVRDDKVVVAPAGEREYDSWKTVVEVGNYLRKYKPGFEVIRWNDSPFDAQKLIVDSRIKSDKVVV